MSAQQPNADRATSSASHIGRALLLVSALSIVMVSVGAFFVSYHFLHEQMQRHLRTLVAFTANESAAALAFRDAEVATEILRAIPASEGITLAEMRDASGNLLAQMRAPRDDFGARLAMRLGGERLSQDVLADGERLGSVTLESGNGPLLRALAGLLGWCILVMLGVALISFSVARRHTHRITQPILELRSIVQRLIQHRDFSQRAPPSNLAEVEELRKEFNTLLDEIRLRDHLLMRTNAALERVAYVDTLTGLPNRAMFEQALARIIETCAQARARAVLFYLDIDAFKTVNDTFGHTAGDALLGEIGLRLRDWQAGESVAARIGGDEFVVLISPLHSEQDASRLGAELQKILDAPVRVNGQMLHPGISVGHAIYPDMADEIEELIRLADQSMYRAKDKRYLQNQITRWGLAAHKAEKAQAIAPASSTPASG
ncbi:MAG: diguanylate cyclase domain-containing protein [Rudaea sp.]